MLLWRTRHVQPGRPVRAGGVQAAELRQVHAVVRGGQHVISPAVQSAARTPRLATCLPTWRVDILLIGIAAYLLYFKICCPIITMSRRSYVFKQTSDKLQTACMLHFAALPFFEIIHNGGCVGADNKQSSAMIKKLFTSKLLRIHNIIQHNTSTILKWNKLAG